jgi:starvation-inducible DNA-binding protein
MRKLNIGLSDEQRAGVIELLNHDLADAYLPVNQNQKVSLGCSGPAV